MGTALWNASISYFQDCGYPKMVVGCLEKNPNRVFYQKKNGKEIGTAKFELTGEPLRENLYLYDISLSSVENILTSLQRSSFRRKFHLRAKEKQYVKQKGIDVIYHHACDFIRERLACAEPIHDGKQTPMKGHPVFLAQHATATCCRGCLEKWHHIPKHRALTEEEIQYIVRVIMRWIQKERVI